MTRKSFVLPLILAMALVIPAVTSGCTLEQAETGDTVRVHYTGRLQNGEVFDTSAGSEPMEFTLGQDQMIPGFEQAVLGMQAGDNKTVTVPADEAYGPLRDDLMLEIGRDEIPEYLEPEVGTQLQSNQPDSSVIVFTITEVSDTTITIDGNHPLAGEELTFNIELVEIMKAVETSSGLTSLPLREALANSKPTLAEFGRGVCIPCKEMKPILEKLAIEYEEKLNVVIVETADNMDLTRQYSIMAIPTQIIFDRNGKEITRHTGFWSREQIVTQLRKMGLD
ncbi:FKBP-type peptidyl-prolyl cis-trans isomerase [Chloroflexota bacterium]